jgi:hypothetical protein
MAGVTASNQNIVNARIMAEMAMEFNIGADILGKGNRHIEKHLGAEKMSGDTVMVPITGGGEVYEELDLSDKDLSVQRDAVPVSVGPLCTAAAVDQETLTLSIKNPEILAKRVANLAMRANDKAYLCLMNNALNSVVINNLDIIGSADQPSGAGYKGRSKLYDLKAIVEGSKMGGETYGVIHPLTWAKLVAMFQGNYAPNTKEGSDLYRNELGELLGIKWTKGQYLDVTVAKDQGVTITGVSYATMFPPATADNKTFGVVDNFGMQAHAPYAVGSYFNPVITGGVGQLADGEISQPFTIDGLYSTDVFGNSTGRLATLRVKNVNGTLQFVGPVFFEGPRQNVTSADYDKDTHVYTPTGTVTGILTAGKSYLPPAVVWKRDDFLVAVKGLEKFYGCDSLTVPTQYREKGILPLRGLCWTDPVKASTIFRVDVLLGMAAFLRTSMAAAYIEAN